MFLCDGCLTKFARQGDLIQHLEKSKNPLCATACRVLREKLRPVQGGNRTQIGGHQESDCEDADFPFPEDIHEGQDGVYVEERSACSDSEDENEDDVEVPRDSVGERSNQRRRNQSVPSNYPEEAAAPSESANAMDVGEDGDPHSGTQAPGGISIESHNRLKAPPVHVTKFGGEAGKPIWPFTHGASGYSVYIEQTGGQNNLWAPFNSRLEWEVARWAKLRGPGATAFTEFLDIEGVSTLPFDFRLIFFLKSFLQIVDALGLLFKNTAELNKIIDTKLPSKRPAFTQHEVLVAGEKYDIFMRDVIECIKALYCNPEHVQYLVFSPERHYADADKTKRLYHDMHTGQWWWSTQVF